MTNTPPLLSLIVSTSNHADTLRATLDSIFAQQDATIECFLVDAGSSDASPEIIKEYSDRLNFFEIVGAEEQVAAVNRAFARARGDLFWWLSGSDKLCPWACRLTSFVFSRLEEVHWLTSGTPLVWTQTQLCVPNGLADGYSLEPFFAGRNLRASPYFRQPIWRTGTVFKRWIWERAGSFIVYPLEQAGDFELWTRLWQYAVHLYTLNVPVAGEQLAARSFDHDEYWRAASRHLNDFGRLDPPSKLKQYIKAQAARRSPRLFAVYAYEAPFVMIAPPTLECAISTHYIV